MRRVCAGLLFLVGMRLMAQAPASTAARPVVTPQLVDITASTGVRFKHLSSSDQRYIVESMSGGVALLDYDGDGWLDIYFTNAPSVAMALKGETARSALFHNNHDGTFTDVTDKAGVANPCWAMGAAVGDYDNDGWPDLLVSCFGGVKLYRNQHDGTFRDVTKDAGLAADTAWATGAVFGDYDNDGFADIFVPHYVDFHLSDLPEFGSKSTCRYHDVAVQCGPRGLKGTTDLLFHNNGNGTFTEVGAEAGVSNPQHYFGLGTAWTDFDNDGKLDLFVANDGQANLLFHNEGDGHFKESGLEAGVALSDDGLEQANMGVAVGDYENKGRMSVAVSHFSDEYMTLYRNDGGLAFTDVARPAGVAAATVPYVGWGDAFVDLNNSGWQDLVLVNGHVYPQVEETRLGIHYREPGVVFLSTHDGKFREATQQVSPALGLPRVSRGLAVGDLFHRGALDVVIENLDGEPTILSSRPDPANTWISLTLEGAPKNKLALNTRVRVMAGGVTQTAEPRSGGSYLSQSDLSLHFGLGRAGAIDRIEVDWRDGPPQVFTNVAPNHFYALREGQPLRVVTFLPAARPAVKR
ncbi:Repeat domain-containing protein [Bryocella elongata]|uniref:Repeat domain-containing protein n=1 Tax=Bryocella elongata TaxID=863522 RepID=A0A1H5WMB4_9BACT|nr:CRTAC1 family protein [Bryocella elongata]SEG00622.1 Repeat domain-containing protein [Bryocella elongata]